MSDDVTWQQFLHRCSDQLKAARLDDGVYAKHYARDVDRLLRMLQFIDDDYEKTQDGIDGSSAFEYTK
jgi:hypothetical protein